MAPFPLRGRRKKGRQDSFPWSSRTGLPSLPVLSSLQVGRIPESGSATLKPCFRPMEWAFDKARWRSVTRQNSSPRFDVAAGLGDAVPESEEKDDGRSTRAAAGMWMMLTCTYIRQSKAAQPIWSLPGLGFSSPRSTWSAGPVGSFIAKGSSGLAGGESDAATQLHEAHGLLGTSKIAGARRNKRRVKGSRVWQQGPQLFVPRGLDLTAVFFGEYIIKYRCSVAVSAISSIEGGVTRRRQCSDSDKARPKDRMKLSRIKKYWLTADAKVQQGTCKVKVLGTIGTIQKHLLLATLPDNPNPH
ncbi:hypothetical protein CI102_13357 [Trichoderma harzianum]|nr:hypothetical protein CI102_13357 [Trichoderma harzianum]